jgi:protein arginine N-methyltransferase 1
MGYLVEEHVGYLADPQRMQAYRSALRSLVRPGAVVVDLGSGTGILGMLACEAGASRVYCIDESSMLGVAKTHITANGYADRCVFLKSHSRDVQLPELVDLVVADQMGSFGLGAGLLESFADAKQRFLKPTGILVPNRLNLYLAGVRAPEFRDALARVRSNAGALDVSHLQHLMLNDVRTVDPRGEPQDLCTSVGELVSLTLGSAVPETITGVVEISATSAGVLDGIAGWFSASLDLANGTELTNAPFSSERIDRRYMFLPFKEPVTMAANDVFRVSLTTMSGHTLVAWHLQKVDASGNRTSLIKQTSLPGNLLSRRHLLQTSGDHRPVLSRRGLMKRYILELCNEERSMNDIISALYERHADQLSSRERAAELVISTLCNVTE